MSEKNFHSKIIIAVLAISCLLIFGAGYGSHSSYVDFVFRVINFGLFIALVCYLWGGKIKAFFAGRSQGIAKEFSDLEEARAEAVRQLKSIDERIAGLDKECQEILTACKAQGEALKEEIVAKAEKSAASMVDQARMTAANELEKARKALREDIAEEIIAEAEKLLRASLDQNKHKALIDKSLSKVVLQ